MVVWSAVSVTLGVLLAFLVFEAWPPLVVLSER